MTDKRFCPVCAQHCHYRNGLYFDAITGLQHSHAQIAAPDEVFGVANDLLSLSTLDTSPDTFSLPDISLPDTSSSDDFGGFGGGGGFSGGGGGSDF